MNSLPQPTRRTLLRTAAWSVPVVTVATAAPAYATSGVTGSIGIAIWTGTANVVSNDVRVNGVKVQNNTNAALPAMNWQVTITMDPSWGTSGSWSGGAGIISQPAGYASGQNPVILILPAPTLAQGAEYDFFGGVGDARWNMPGMPGLITGDVMTVSVRPQTGYANVTAGTDSDTIVAGSW